MRWTALAVVMFAVSCLPADAAGCHHSTLFTLDETGSSVAPHPDTTCRDGDSPFDRLFVTEPTADAPSPLSLDAIQNAPEKEPEHTGLRALFRESGIDFLAFPRRRSTYVILAIGGAAAAAIHPVDDEIAEHIVGSKTAENVFKVGKYIGLGWVQAGTAMTTYLIGRYAMKPTAGRRTNKVAHLGFDLLRANILTQALTYGIKGAVRRDRPTGECCSFPSGHASVTFAAAAVFERHLGLRGAWPTMLAATYVGASRMVDGRHFASDVIFGAALGIAAGWTVVGRHGRENFALMPVPVRGGMAVMFNWSPAATPTP